MLKTTFIARASDGLILCETYDSVTDSQGKIDHSMIETIYYEKLVCNELFVIVEKLKNNARTLMKKLPQGDN